MIARLLALFRSLFWRKPKPAVIDWSKCDRAYLEALDELNKEIPTDDPSEESLSNYLKEEKRREKYSIKGSWATLYSPGLGSLFQGGLGAMNGIQDRQLYQQQQSALMNQQYGSALQNAMLQQQQTVYPGKLMQLDQQQALMGKHELLAQLLGNPEKKS